MLFLFFLRRNFKNLNIMIDFEKFKNYLDSEEGQQAMNRMSEKVYGEEWDYWNAWIDTKLPK